VAIENTYILLETYIYIIGQEQISALEKPILANTQIAHLQYFSITPM